MCPRSDQALQKLKHCRELNGKWGSPCCPPEGVKPTELSTLELCLTLLPNLSVTMVRQRHQQLLSQTLHLDQQM